MASSSSSTPLLLSAFIFLLALYCGFDPLNHSPMANFPGFKAYSVEDPPLEDIPNVRDEEDRLRKAELRFVGEVQGPESITFDAEGKGPYTGVANGRVVMWDGEAWRNFAYTSNNRSELCNWKPNPFSYWKNEHICGRPLGIRFHKKTGDLYIADAYFGMMKVGPEGGLATAITTEAEGVPFKFTNDFDIDDEGNIYFTDSSFIYPRRNFVQLIFTADPSGRLLKYNATTKETTVLARNLQFPNGVSLSKDRSFLVFCEGALGRLSRYWLKGEKAGTKDVFAVLPGFPDNIRTNKDGDFWVALHCRRGHCSSIVSINPTLRSIILRLPIPIKYLFGGKLQGVVVKYNKHGELVQILEDSEGKVVRAASEVEEKDGKLWIGSVLMPFIAVYPLDQ